jgi:integrase
MQGFFTARLPQQRVSAHTISSYRDCMRLLLGFAQGRTGKQPSQLDLADLDAKLVAAFLDHLEADRRNGIGTRNLRLTAVQSLFRYAQLQCPEHAALIARVLAIPAKRRDITVVSYLTRAETDALMASPDRSTALGWRDHLLIVVGVQTGLRVSELRVLRWADVTFGAGANLYTKGKGRRDRHTPLLPATASLLHGWMRHRDARPDEPVFATRRRTALSTDAVADLIDRHVAIAVLRCPSLGRKKVTPHTLRHTCAMNLLHDGFDLVTIALWLGHSSTKSTEIYLHGDTTLKEKALRATAPTPTAGHRYRAPDKLLAFLESL